MRIKALLVTLAALPLLMAQDSTGISGTWNLIEATASVMSPPQHRMVLRFRVSPSEVRGAVVSRVNGSEIPLASSEVQGNTLRFRLRDQADAPVMVMTRSGDLFYGAWTDGVGTALGPVFKLVRTGDAPAR